MTVKVPAHLVFSRSGFSALAPGSRTQGTLGNEVNVILRLHRHYFVNKGPSSQGYGFPVVMYGCESWTIKKAERWRIDAFELWCWRSPLNSKEIKPVNPKGNQS